MTNSKKSTTWITLGVILIALAAYFITKQPAKTPETLFAEHYVKESALVENIYKDMAQLNLGARGADAPDTTTLMYRGVRILKTEVEKLEKDRRALLLTSLDYFKKFKWQESRKNLIDYVEMHKEPEADYRTALYYLAKSKLNQGDYAKAIDVFTDFFALAEKEDGLLKAAKWDRALCYLNVNEDRAKALFQDIALDNGDDNQDEAQSLLAFFD